MKVTESRRFAALDIGSNTIRFLAAELSGSSFNVLHSSQVITRLGQGAQEKRALTGSAMERTLDGIEKLLSQAAALKPFRLAAVATHAVRDAKNATTFAQNFEKRFGLALNVIDQQTEAALALKGAAMVVGGKSTILLFDIGGGSTEFVSRNGAGKITFAGNDLGVVRLTETYIKSAPMVMDEYDRLYAYIKEEVAKIAVNLDAKKPFKLVGTAGTVTSMAAVHFHVYPYDPEKINNSVLELKDVEKLLENIGAKSIEERSRLPELQNGREDLIIPGIGIVLAVMETFGHSSITVCDSGLREGILLSVIDGKLPTADIK